MQNYAKSVATEILRQLGGNRFIVMTGAKSFSYFDENGDLYLICLMKLLKNLILLYLIHRILKLIG